MAVHRLPAFRSALPLPDIGDAGISCGAPYPLIGSPQTLTTAGRRQAAGSCVALSDHCDEAGFSVQTGAPGLPRNHTSASRPKRNRVLAEWRFRGRETVVWWSDHAGCSQAECTSPSGDGLSPCYEYSQRGCCADAHGTSHRPRLVPCTCAGFPVGPGMQPANPEGERDLSLDGRRPAGEIAPRAASRPRPRPTCCPSPDHAEAPRRR